MNDDSALTWTWPRGESTKTIRIDGATLLSSDSGTMPDTNRFTLVSAFDDARMMFIDRPEIFAEVMRALASLLSDEELLEARSRRRRAFWLALDACKPLQLTWSYPRVTSSPPQLVTLDLSAVSALCTAPPPDAYAVRAWQSLEDLFFFGPLEPGIPAATREVLVTTILAALKPGNDLTASDAFPAIDHTRIAPASWTWDKRDDGESGASIGGPSVVIGYQYGHDYGWGAYSVERVLTGGPELSVYAPADIWDEIVEALRAAVEP